MSIQTQEAIELFNSKHIHLRDSAQIRNGLIRFFQSNNSIGMSNDDIEDAVDTMIKKGIVIQFIPSSTSVRLSRNLSRLFSIDPSECVACMNLLVQKEMFRLVGGKLEVIFNSGGVPSIMNIIKGRVAANQDRYAIAA